MAVVGVSLLVGPTIAAAAPAPPETGYFEAPYRKMQEEYDREANASGEARDAFSRGLVALDNSDFDGAFEEFKASLMAFPSYAAAFNEAVSRQLAGRYQDAAVLYSDAQAMSGNDPELETNLAVTLAQEGKEDASAKPFDAALSHAPGAALHGRILYQRALVQFRFGHLFASIDSLRKADEAFVQADSGLGRAMVTARRGAMMLTLGDPEGEALLLNAIPQMRSAGALVDEAAAHTVLTDYYFGKDELQKAEPQITRAIQASEAAHQWTELGRALNNLGIYHFREGRNTEAISYYEQAIGNFQKARDRVGEGEPTNNLGGIYLKSGDIDRGFVYVDRAVRLYRQGRATTRALEKALQLADTFRQLGSDQRRKYFLDIAYKLSNDIGEPSIKARVLLALARYHVDTDESAAKTDLKNARTIFMASNDTSGLEAADLINERLSAVRYAQTTRFILFVILGVWGTLWLRRIWPSIQPAAGIVLSAAGAPFRRLASGYHQLDSWWTGQTVSQDEETTREFDRYRLRIFRWFFSAAILVVLAFEAWAVTIPNLVYVFNTKHDVARASEVNLFPPDVTDGLQALLNHLAIYVGFAALAQVALFAIGLTLALFIFGFIETAAFGALQRLMRRIEIKADPKTRATTLEALHRLQVRFALVLIAVFVVGGAIVYVNGWPSEWAALGFLAFTFVLEVVLFVRLRRRLAKLPSGQQNAAFQLVARIGTHKVTSIVFGLWAFAYLLLPAFYFLSRIVQMRLILRPFTSAEQQFLSLAREAVQKYGTVVFVDDMALIFPRLVDAYDPSTGPTLVWSDLLEPFLLYFFWFWAILTVFRLLVPFAASLGWWSGAWKVLRAALIAAMFAAVFDPLFMWLFHLGETGHLAVVGLAILLSVFVEHSVMAATRHPTQDSEATPLEHAGPTTKEPPPPPPSFASPPTPPTAICKISPAPNEPTCKNNSPTGV
jgi:tetratricopeptide (TPR) repeat protein